MTTINMTAVEKFAQYKEGMIECGLSFWDLADDEQDNYYALERAAREEEKGA